MKKVVICGSLYNEAKKWKAKLETEGYKVIRYPDKISNITGKGLYDYKNAHIEHYKKINECDIVFVINLDKDGIKNYIGPSVFAEIAYTIGLNMTMDYNIDIFLLNPIPEKVPYREELELWKKLGWIKMW